MLAAASCRIGEHIAEAPVDALAGGAVDAAEEVDAPIDVPEGTPGLTATIGERPEVTGSCGALDDRAELQDRFDPPVQQQVVTAGWDFDTDADSYNHASYGFMPNWASAQSGRFSVRFHGTVQLEAGMHCFSVDIGATGTDIINGRNGCGQVWLAGATTATAETGFEAATAGPATGCVDVASAGPIELDIVFWYFNIFERARLTVRHCAGAGCTPAEALSAMQLRAL
ncbi:MAG: hypothetical protein K8M05_32535 [Deltaproteobacteria bacterium]|nr:hypothetical protein [Kofleriaceae bacterium]